MMGRPKSNEEKIQTSLYLTKDEKKYLGDNGISITKFFRQALLAKKQGLWSYRFNNEKVIEDDTETDKPYL